MSSKSIKKIASELSSINGVDAVYLFGSHATGKQKPYSDIDICVVTDSPITQDERSEILATSSKKIDIHILSDLPLYIQFRVFRDGRLLLVNSQQALLRARVEVVKRYLDFQHRLQKYYGRILS